jgi:hypothetical protein
MTNPATPPSKGGMPKWLIILLVILLVIILGCCGIFTTCFYLARKGVQAAQSAGAQIQIDAEQRIKDEQQRLANQATQNGNNGGSVAPGGVVGPSGNSGTGGTGEAGGNAGGGNAAGGNPGNNVGDRAIAEGLGAGKLPVNFPTDVPVMKGLSPSSISMADKVKGTGMVALTGKVTREDAAAFYDKQMKDQGWTETENQDVMNQTIMQFTKDKRKATVQVVTDSNNGTMVNIAYETTQ